MFTETGPLVALAVAIALLVGIAGPASAQFFNFGGFGGTAAAPAPQRGGGWFGGDFFAPFQQQAARKRRAQDFSKAPPPEKRDTVPERNVLVLGDAMADWLAYGLEDAYAEQPDMGVIRKHKTVSGLIKYQPKGEPADWAAAAKGILATEKPDAIVVMLGLNDRVAIREPAAEKQDPTRKTTRRTPRAKPDAQAADANPAQRSRTAQPTPPKPDDKPVDTELSPDDAADNDAPPVIAPEKSARSPNGLYEFRDERWVELYTKKIEEMIGVLKSKGVPVLWVGLPAVRGAKGDRRHAVPGFAVSRCRRQGRHHLCRCLGRLCRRSRPLPAEGPGLRRPDPPAALLRRRVFHQGRRAQARALCRARDHAAAGGALRRRSRCRPNRRRPTPMRVPGQPAPRPLAGPILPLVASSVGTDQLLGGPGSRPAAVDALAARTLVKGEPLAPPAGRADDFAWPRREIGREQAKGETPVASRIAGWQRRRQRCSAAAAAEAEKAAPAEQSPASRRSRDFFGFGTAPRQPQPRRRP